MLNWGAWSLDMTAGASCRSSWSTRMGLVSRNSIGYPPQDPYLKLARSRGPQLSSSFIHFCCCMLGGWFHDLSGVILLSSASLPWTICPSLPILFCNFKTVILWCIHNTSKRPATAARLCCSMTAQPQATKITLAPASFPSLFLGQRLSMCELVKSIIVLLSCLKLKKNLANFVEMSLYHLYL